MRLEKVVYLNVHSLAHRVEPMEASFDVRGVPMSARERFIGIDGADYASIDALLEDAPTWLGQVRGHPIDNRQGSIAVHWSQHCLYESLASSLTKGQCALVLLDDTHLGRPWHAYVRLAFELPDFDIVQLWPWDPLFPTPSGDTPYRQCYEDILESLPPVQVCEDFPDFTAGIYYPGDNALIVSAEGARLICGHFEKTPWEFLEWGLMRLVNARTFSSHIELREQWIEFVFAYEDSHRLRVDGEI